MIIIISKDENYIFQRSCVPYVEINNQQTTPKLDVILIVVWKTSFMRTEQPSVRSRCNINHITTIAPW